MQISKEYPLIEETKDKIINISLIFASVIGTLIYLVSLSRYSKTGFEISFVTDIIVLAPIIAITIFRKRLSIKTKAITIIGVIYILFLIHVSHFGVFTGDKVLIIIIPFLSLLAFSLRITIAIFLSVLISFLILAYLHLSGILTLHQQNPAIFSTWFINIMLLAIVSFVIVTVQTRFNITYSKLITNLEENNKLLSEKERNYRELFNASTDAIFIHDLEGRILDVNLSMLKIYGYDQEDIPDLTIDVLSSQMEGFTTREATGLVQKAIRGETVVADWHARKKDGDFFWVEVALKKSTIGDHERVLAVVRDITAKKEDEIQLALFRNHLKELVAQKTEELEQANEELKVSNENLSQQKEELISTLSTLQATQQQLYQSEKMASLGVLTAGVAHEINNPLNFIAGGIQGLETYFQDNIPGHTENVTPLINAVHVGVKRVADIVSSLNHYSRRNDLPLNSCNINSIIDNCLVMLNNQVKDRIEIKRIYADIPVRISCSEGKLHQALINIIANAVQSITGTGTVTINTKMNNNYLIISVADTGSGISKENLGKIFDPFFTTKDPGKGTGLGLSITYNIIKEHQGFIEVESQPDKGTCVTVRIPIT